jgi:hypothetical protein
MSIDPDWRRARLREAVIRHGSQAALGRALDLSSGAYIRQMLAGERAISEKTIEAIEALPGMDGWFSRGSLSVGEASHGLGQSLRKVTAPLAWEALTTMRQLPKRFGLVLPDNAMAPAALAGDEVEFMRDAECHPGDLALIANGAGQHYVRELAQLLDGSMVGRASNSAFPDVPLSGDARVVAVMTHIKYGGGWDALKTRRLR